jgi:hypothetical protein
MDTYGILAVNHEFFACNDKTALNDVQGTVLDLDVFQARGREKSYKRHAGLERPEEVEVLRLAKLTANNAVNQDFFPCNHRVAIDDVQGSLISIDVLPSPCAKVCNACS